MLKMVPGEGSNDITARQKKKKQNNEGEEKRNDDTVKVRASGDNVFLNHEGK